jgi:hypothetical protein
MLKTGGVKSPRQLSGSRSAKRLGAIIEDSLNNKGCTFRPYQGLEGEGGPQKSETQAIRRVESDLQSATFRGDSYRESSEGGLNSARPFKLINTNNDYYIQTTQKGSA